MQKNVRLFAFSDVLWPIEVLTHGDVYDPLLAECFRKKLSEWKVGTFFLSKLLVRGWP